MGSDTVTTKNVEKWTRVGPILRALEAADWPKAIFEGQVFAETSGHIGKSGTSGERSIIQILPSNLKAYNRNRVAAGKPAVSIHGADDQHIAVGVANATTLAFARDYLEHKNPEAAQAGGYDNMYLRLQCYNAGTPAITASLGSGSIGRYEYPAKVAAYLLFKAEQYEGTARAQEYLDAYGLIRDGAIKAGREEKFDEQTKAKLGKTNWLDNKGYQNGAIAYIDALKAPAGAKVAKTESTDTPLPPTASDVPAMPPQAVNGAPVPPATTSITPTPVAPIPAPAAATPEQTTPAAPVATMSTPLPLSVARTQRYFQTALNISTGGVDGIIEPQTEQATEIVETALVSLGYISAPDKADTYLDRATRKLLAKPEIQAELKAVFAGIPGVLESISGGAIDRAEVLAGVAPLRAEIERNARHVVDARQKGSERS